jgi:hypothetical protein
MGVAVAASSMHLKKRVAIMREPARAKVRRQQTRRIGIRKTMDNKKRLQGKTTRKARISSSQTNDSVDVQMASRVNGFFEGYHVVLKQH